jgi:hypothetical protein
VDALGNDVSAEQIRVYLGKQFGMQVRPNHLGDGVAAPPPRRPAQRA